MSWAPLFDEIRESEEFGERLERDLEASGRGWNEEEQRWAMSCSS